MTEEKINIYIFLDIEKVSSFYFSRSNISALKNDRENETKRTAKKQFDSVKISSNKIAMIPPF